MFISYCILFKIFDYSFRKYTTCFKHRSKHLIFT